MKKLILILFYTQIIINSSFSQCTFTAIPGSCNSTITTNPLTAGTYAGGSGYYYCYSPSNNTQGTTASIVLGNSGTTLPGHLIINSPANLVITSLSINNNYGGVLYIASGAKVTITNAVTLPLSAATIAIVNYGTLIFNGAVTLNGGTLQTASTSATTTFNSTFNVSYQNSYRSKGTTTSVGAVTINGAGGTYSACLDNNSYWSVGAFTISSSAQIQTSSGGTSLINYTGAISLNTSTAYTNNTVKFCKNGGSGTCDGTINVQCQSSSCSNPNGALPVLLSKFYAKPEPNGNNIIWETAQEFNNDHFEIERSYDGENFEKIAYIAGSGTKNSTTTYMFFDDKVNNDFNVYYRLKQVDFDGFIHYSNIIYLNGNEENASSVTLYPNPLEEGTTLNLKFGDFDEGDAQISLYDLAGKLIDSYTIDAVKPNGIYEVEDKDLLLAKGTYLLEIKTQHHVYNQKLDIQ